MGNVLNYIMEIPGTKQKRHGGKGKQQFALAGTKTMSCGEFDHTGDLFRLLYV